MQASRRAHASGAAVAHAQQALAAMAADIRSAVARGDVRMTALDARYEDLDADTIDFLIPAPGRRSEDPRTGGIYEVGYYIDNDPATDAQWLLRRTDTTLDDDPLEGGNVRPAGAGVSELNLEFYDGQQWVPGWSDSNSFPSAVRIGITVVDPDGKGKPLHFETTVSIPAR